MMRWVGARIADHDRFYAESIENTNPDPSSAAIGVRFARRSNDTLRQLGYEAGIAPRLDAKVAFDGSGESLRIATFANGPGGGPAELCRAG